MAIDERSRHAMYQRLEEVLGAEEAGTLMEHLPPVGWADVATKRDLEVLEVKLSAEMDRRFARIELRFAELTRTVVLTSLGSVIGAVSLAFAAARL